MTYLSRHEASLPLAGILIFISFFTLGFTAAQWKYAEVGTRNKVVHAVTPEYPKPSLTRRVTGTAVAEVTFNATGQVVDVKILQSPDEYIARELMATLAKWVFRPEPELIKTNGTRRGKLTFYFNIVDGVGKVLNPDEMPIRRRGKEDQ